MYRLPEEKSGVNGVKSSTAAAAPAAAASATGGDGALPGN
jgi:hypothetical protein